MANTIVINARFPSPGLLNFVSESLSNQPSSNPIVTIYARLSLTEVSRE